MRQDATATQTEVQQDATAKQTEVQQDATATLFAVRQELNEFKRLAAGISQMLEEMRPKDKMEFADTGRGS